MLRTRTPKGVTIFVPLKRHSSSGGSRLCHKTGETHEFRFPSVASFVGSLNSQQFELINSRPGNMGGQTRTVSSPAASRPVDPPTGTDTRPSADPHTTAPAWTDPSTTSFQRDEPDGLSVHIKVRLRQGYKWQNGGILLPAGCGFNRSVRAAKSSHGKKPKCRLAELATCEPVQ